MADREYPIELPRNNQRDQEAVNSLHGIHNLLQNFLSDHVGIQIHSDSDDESGSDDENEQSDNQEHVLLQNQGNEDQEEDQARENDNSEGNYNPLSFPNFDLGDLVDWVSYALPYVIGFITIFILNNFLLVTNLIPHVIILIRMNEIIKVQLKEPAIRYKNLFYTFLICGLNALLVILVVSTKYSSLSSLFFFPPRHLAGFWDAIFMLLFNDFIFKYVTIMVKILVLLLCENVSIKKRGQLLSVVEMFSLYYRSCAPIAVWLKYFLLLEFNSMNMVSFPYLILKFSPLIKRAKILFLSIKYLFMKSVPFGTVPTREELLENDGECTICQEAMKQPIKLVCNHLFCEECVSEWFQSKNTCPLCRTVVPNAGRLQARSDGSTSQSPLIF